MARKGEYKLVITEERKGDGLERAGEQTDTFRTKLRRLNRVAVTASLAVVAGFAAMGRGAVDLNREIELMDQKAETVFGDQIDLANEWAENNRRAYGLSERGTRALLAATTDLLVPLGFEREEATGLAIDLQDLTGALADNSQGKFDTEQVSQKLNAAITGEREGLKELGIVISEADIQARLALKGQEDLTGEALKQAKAQATLELMTEQSTDAIHNWENGGKDAAEQANGTTSNFAEMKEELAQGMKPVLDKVVDGLNAFSSWAQENTGLFQTLIAIVGGLAVTILAVNAAVKVGTALKAAWAVATGIATAAQWALNTAMFANPIFWVIAAIVALIAIIVLLVIHWDTVKAAAGVAWDFIWAKASFVFNWIKNNWPLILAILTGPIGVAVLMIVRHWDTIKSGFSSAMSWVKDRVSDAKRWIVDRFNEVVDFFRGLPGKIRDAFVGLGSAISDGFKSVWNSTVGGFGFTVPSWVPGVGGKEFRIPTLAEGGIVTSATLALIGERGPEAVVPLDKGIGLGGPSIVINVAGSIRSDRDLVKLIRDELDRGGLGGRL